MTGDKCALSKDMKCVFYIYYQAHYLLNKAQRDLSSP